MGRRKFGYLCLDCCFRNLDLDKRPRTHRWIIRGGSIVPWTPDINILLNKLKYSGSTPKKKANLMHDHPDISQTNLH